MISLVCDKGNLLALFELEFFLVNTNLNKVSLLEVFISVVVAHDYSF